MAGAGVTALCATYIAITAVGLSQTTVGPLIAVPESTSSQVAGFPDSSGSVPGLLVAAPQAAPKAVSPKPVRAAATDKTATDKRTTKTTVRSRTTAAA